jgi:hypothetical protein
VTIQVLLAEVHIGSGNAELFLRCEPRSGGMTGPGCCRTQEMATCANEQPNS